MMVLVKIFIEFLLNFKLYLKVIFVIILLLILLSVKVLVLILFNNLEKEMNVLDSISLRELGFKDLLVKEFR